MAKIIIDIKDDIHPTIALEAVKLVVEGGKVSHDTKGNEYYCWATVMGTTQGNICVITRPYRKNDCFIVQKEK